MKSILAKIKNVSWPIIGLLLLTLAVFHRVIFMGETYFAGDILSYYYPVRFFVQKWLNQNIIPLWCPQIFNGFPLLAAAQSGIFNPIERIVFTLFPPVFAYNVNIAAHYFLGGASMYALIMHLTNTKEIAFFSAVSLAFSGFFFIYLNYITIFSLCYLPLSLLIAYKCFTKLKLVYVAGLAVILGIQFFAGSPQYTLYTL